MYNELEIHTCTHDLKVELSLAGNYPFWSGDLLPNPDRLVKGRQTILSALSLENGCI